MLVDPYRATAPLPPNLVPVPTVKQETDFSCGTAVALSVLRLWRWDAYARVEEAALYAALRTTESDGTEPEPMAAYLRAEAQLEAEYRNGDVTLAELEAALDRGEPPIVDLQAWRDDDRPWSETWNAGHYVLLVGHDAERLFVMDPSVLTPGAYAWMPRGELVERWHDLTGPANVRAERMTIFVRGAGPKRSPDVAGVGTATRLG
jgi:predicted double-glycine peptidase